MRGSVDLRDHVVDQVRLVSHSLDFRSATIQFRVHFRLRNDNAVSIISQRQSENKMTCLNDARKPLESFTSTSRSIVRAWFFWTDVCGFTVFAVREATEADSDWAVWASFACVGRMKLRWLITGKVWNSTHQSLRCCFSVSMWSSSTSRSSFKASRSSNSHFVDFLQIEVIFIILKKINTLNKKVPYLVQREVTFGQSLGHGS